MGPETGRNVVGCVRRSTRRTRRPPCRSGEVQRHRRLVLGRRQPRHRVVREDQPVAEVGGGPRGGLHAHVRGDPGEHQGVDAALPQARVQLGALESPDRALDQQRVRDRGDLRYQIAAGWLLGRPRPARPHRHHRRARRAEGRRQPHRRGDHLRPRVRGQRQRDDPVHQVDEHEGGTGGVETRRERGLAGVAGRAVVVIMCGHDRTLPAGPASRVRIERGGVVGQLGRVRIASGTARTRCRTGRHSASGRPRVRLPPSSAGWVQHR